MEDLVSVREKLIPVTLNLTQAGKDFMQASAGVTSRSMSGWLRRVLAGLEAGTVGPVRPGQAASAPSPGRPVLARGDAPPEGLEWVLVTITEADIGREAWMKAGDARVGGV